MAKVEPIPEGYPRVSPYLAVDNCSEAIRFYSNVLGARERMRMPAPDEAVIMLSDEYPEMDVRSPKSIGGTPVILNVYVEDVDAVFSKALQAGARPLREVEDQFYGDRSGQFEDPFGHRWSVATHIEDVSPDEMARRVEQAMEGS